MPVTPFSVDTSEQVFQVLAMELNDPLTEEELDELDAFLMSDATGEEAMDIAMLDGFLTALAIGPNTLPPSQWLPHVWGGEMLWESAAQAQHMMSLVFRHANDISSYLRQNPDSFEPLLYEREQEGRTIMVVDEWCSGFVEGMALDEEAWRPLLESEEGDDLLYPILLYGTEAGFEELMANAELHDADHDEVAASLGERILAIKDWWLPARKAKATVRREQPKVGRNELCPCGSGKKFKKCCGGQKTLH